MQPHLRQEDAQDLHEICRVVPPGVVPIYGYGLWERRRILLTKAIEPGAWNSSEVTATPKRQISIYGSEIRSEMRAHCDAGRLANNKLHSNTRIIPGSPKHILCTVLPGLLRAF